MIEYSKLRFLIVDDVTDFRSALTSMLRQLGVAEIVAATSGEQALSLCRRSTYDVILHGYQLGAGKNGQQVLEELHHQGLISPHAVFVILSADNSQAMVLAALECEPDSYLTIPFNLTSLRQRLDALLRMKSIFRPVFDAQLQSNHLDVLKACARITQQHPDYAPHCHRHQVAALAGLGRQQDQEQLLQKLVDERPTPWALVALGNLWRTTNRLDQARTLYEEGIHQFPMLPALYDGLAATAVAQGDPEQAQQFLAQGLRVSPNSLQRQQRMGQLAQQNQDHDQATRSFRQAVELGRHSLFSDPEDHLNLVSSLNAQAGDGRLGHRPLAEIRKTLSELHKTWQADQPLQIRAQLLQARSLVNAGQAAEAQKLAVQAAAQVADLEGFFSADAALQVAEQLRQLGQPEQADRVLAICAEMYGDDPAVLADIARYTDDPAILQAGSHAIEWNRQAMQLYQQQDYPAALQLFRQALASQPRNISFALNTAQSLLRLLHGTTTAELITECQRCLHQASGIPASDPRRERYQKLAGHLDTLTSDNPDPAPLIT